MRRLFCLLGIVLCLGVGCVAEGERPPWQRPGLASGKMGETLSKALKDTDDEMQMQSDRPASQRQVDPRPPSPPDF
jgi:hypothetical protein